MTDIAALLFQSRAVPSPFSTRAADLAGLITDLRSFGIEPAGGQRFDELRQVRPPTPPDPDGRYLDLTPEEFQRLAGLRAQAHTLGQAVTEDLRTMLDRTARELRTSMAVAADSYIRALQPRFTTAADGVKAAVKAGITTGDDDSTVIEKSPEAITAWRQLKNQHVPELERILAVRIGLSLHLGIPPVNQSGDRLGQPIDYSIAITQPYRPGGLQQHANRFGPSWQTWLDLATSLHLCTTDELDPAELLTAQRVDLHEPHVDYLNEPFDAMTDDEPNMSGVKF